MRAGNRKGTNNKNLIIGRIAFNDIIGEKRNKIYPVYIYFSLSKVYTTNSVHF